MYRLQIYVENPLMGENRLLTYQFDPATFDQKTWDARFPDIMDRIASLTASAATSSRFTVPSL
jgi:hypothetical protein